MKTASELIQMLRDVELNFSRLYANVAAIEGQYNPRLKTAAMVLSHQESDHAKAYDDMQKNLREKGDLRLSEVFHEKARVLLHDFRHGVATREMGNVNALIDFAVAYERQNAELLRALSESVDASQQPELLKLINDLVDIEKEHSSTLLGFRKPEVKA